MRGLIFAVLVTVVLPLHASITTSPSGGSGGEATNVVLRAAVPGLVNTNGTGDWTLTGYAQSANTITNLFSGQTNLYGLAFYGDSIIGGVDATFNQMPFMVHTNMAPFFTLVHGLFNQEGSYPNMLAQSHPGQNPIHIADAALDATNAFALPATSIVWSGRNVSWIEAFPGTTATNIVYTNINRMIAAFNHSNYLVLSILAAASEKPDSVSFRNITNFNRAMSQIYSNHFYDWWADLGATGGENISSNYIELATDVHLKNAAHNIIATGVVTRLPVLQNTIPATVGALNQGLQVVKSLVIPKWRAMPLWSIKLQTGTITPALLGAGSDTGDPWYYTTAISIGNGSGAFRFRPIHGNGTLNVAHRLVFQCPSTMSFTNSFYSPYYEAVTGRTLGLVTDVPVHGVTGLNTTYFTNTYANDLYLREVALIVGASTNTATRYLVGWDILEY